MNRIQQILEEMHEIMNPGEYGNGSEPESIPNDDKKAWETVGDLRDELESLLLANGLVKLTD